VHFGLLRVAGLSSDSVTAGNLSEGVEARVQPVVVGEECGELVAIDLRDDMTLVEYAPAGDRSVEDGRWNVLIALVLLNVLDVISTVAVLAAGGTESNPLMRPLIEGVWPAVLLKTVVLVLVAWLLHRCSDSRRIAVMMACTAGWYIAVVSWNVTVFAFA